MNKDTQCRATRIHQVHVLKYLTAAGLMFFALLGCTGENSHTVGKLSMPYSGNLSVTKEITAASFDLPVGMTSTAGSILANDDYSIVILLVEVDDPDSLGLSALEEYWSERALTSANEESIKELDEKMPGMRKAIEDTLTKEPELLKIDGYNSLMAVAVLNGVRTTFCYIEVDGKIVGAVRGIFSESDYQENPEYFDNIFSNITVV